MPKIFSSELFPIALSLVAIVGTYIVYLSFGKSRIEKYTSNKNRKIILSIPIMLLIAVAYASTFAHEKNLDLQLKLLKSAISNFKEPFYENAPLETTKIKVLKKEFSYRIDSLEAVKTKISTEEKIFGSKSNALDLLDNYQKRLKSSIDTLSLYNNVFDKQGVKKKLDTVSLYDLIFDSPELKNRKGFTVSGDAKNIILTCPEDTISEYVNIKLSFQSDTIVDKIGYILIAFSQEKLDKTETLLFTQEYVPHGGTNLFSVKNYFKNGNTKLDVGYILKSDMDDKLPKFYKVTCKNY